MFGCQVANAANPAGGSRYRNTVNVRGAFKCSKAVQQYRSAKDRNEELVTALHPAAGATCYYRDSESRTRLGRVVLAGQVQMSCALRRACEDHAAGCGLKNARNRDVELSVDIAHTGVDDYHRPIFQEPDALPWLLALVQNPQPDALSRNYYRTE